MDRLQRGLWQDLGSGAGGGTSERQAFRNFMCDVCALDKSKSLSALVWQASPGPVRLLLEIPSNSSSILAIEARFTNTLDK